MIEFFNNNFFKVRLSIYSIQYNNLFSIIIMLCVILVFQESFYTNLAECMDDESSITEEELDAILSPNGGSRFELERSERSTRMESIRESRRYYMSRVDFLTAQFKEETAKQEALLKSTIEEMEKQEALFKSTLDSEKL